VTANGSITGKLARKQEEAILALLTQRNVEDAARVAKVAPRTLYRWMKDRAFDAAYRDAKRAAFKTDCVFTIDREDASDVERSGLDTREDYGRPEHAGVHPRESRRYDPESYE
jgi:hypothetical protein